jgi:hypothetical protein
MESDTLKKVLTEVKEGETTAIELVRGMGDDAPIAELRITNTPATPIRAESPPRQHVFYNVAGFLSYLAANATGETVILTDPDKLTAKAVIDDRAVNGFEYVQFQPKYHPLMKMVKSTILAYPGQAIEIKRFAGEVMRCRQVIAKADNLDRNQISMLMQQVSVSSQIVAKHGTGKVATNGVMCKTTVKGELQDGTEIDLPDAITLELPIYIGTDPIKFDVFLTVTTVGNNAAITVDAPDLDVKKFEVFEKMLQPIAENESVLFSRGSVGSGHWLYVK